MARKAANYYEILGVSLSATPTEIEDRFSTLKKNSQEAVLKEEIRVYLKKCSTNNLPADSSIIEDYEKRIQSATESFSKVTLAYSVLSDPVKRNVYNNLIQVSTQSEVVLSFNPVRIDFGQIDVVDTAKQTLVIQSVSGDIEGKRLKITVPDWLVYDIFDTDGSLPFRIEISIHAAILPIGEHTGDIVFEVGLDEFIIPVSVNVVDLAKAETVIADSTEIVLESDREEKKARMAKWDRKWIPIFVAIAVILSVAQVFLTIAVGNKPDPFSQFCTRPVVQLSGLHINVTDNGLFMYGKLSAVLIVNGEEMDVPEIPSEIVVHSFVKTIVLSSVSVKTGDHMGETQTCDKTLFPTS